MSALLDAVFNDFPQGGQLSAADGQRGRNIKNFGAPCGCVFIVFVIVQSNQAVEGVAEDEGIAVDADDFVAQQFFPVNQGLR